MSSLILFTLLAISLTVYGSPTYENSDNTVQNVNPNPEEVLVRKLGTKCTQKDSNSCIMLKWMAYMNRMFKKSSVDIGHNFKMIQNKGLASIDPEPEDDLLLSRSARSDDEQLGIIVAEKLWSFIRSRTLRYRMYDDADIVMSTESSGHLNIGLSINPRQVLETGRGRMKMMGPLLAAIATKVGVIAALVFKGIVLLVGKALIVSKVALLLAVIIGVKKLLSKKHVTYEVVAHPHHGETHHGHDTYSSGWGRALDGFLDTIEVFSGVPTTNDEQDLAYAKQKPF